MDPSILGLIIGLVLVVIVVLLIMPGRGKEKATLAGSQPQAQPEAKPVVEAPAPPKAEVAAPIPAKADDLVIIEGIGPKIAGILKQNGITSFAQLAATELPTLEKILKENGLQFVKPASWAQQASLAAAGKMDELKALQDKLNAGR